MQTITENELKVLISLIKSAIRSAVADAGTAADAKVKVVSDRLDRLVDGSASEAIDTFNEIEAFLRGLTDSDSLTGLLQQLRTGLETQIATKVDKVIGKGLSANDYTDDDRETVEAVAGERRQFTVPGVYVSAHNGGEVASTAYASTGKILINRSYPIVVSGQGTVNVAAIAFYAANGGFISAINFATNGIKTVEPEDIPEKALYFRSSSYIGQPYYWHNGPTREAREGAIVQAFAELEAYRSVQHNHIGYIYVENGHILHDSDDINPRHTPLIPINRNYPIVNYANGCTANAALIALYDAAGEFLGAVNRRINKNLPGAVLDYANGENATFGTTTIPVDAIPPQAVYFRCGSNGAEGESLTKSWYSNGPTQEARESAVSEAIISSKEALFIDQFNKAAGSNGRYDPKNAPDPEHPYYLNKLWLTYNEAMLSYITRRHLSLDNHGFYVRSAIKTNMLPNQACGAFNYMRNGDYVFAYCENVEIIRFSLTTTTVYNSLCRAFLNCSKLREILGNISISTASGILIETFHGCKALQEVRITALKQNIALPDSPLLSHDSVSFMVNNAQTSMGGTGITITVHPDVYAKLTDTTNAQWHAVLEAATAKNIQFATTE